MAKKTARKSKSAKTKTSSKQLIRKDMTIEEVVNLHPETVMVMMKNGLHCVGCHVAAWETIEQGAQGHGMGEKEIEKMVNEINEKISSKKKH